MRDKNGKRIKQGDLIKFDIGLLGDARYLVQRVRYSGKKYGWIAERLTGEPTPQCIGGLGHRFIKLSSGAKE